MNEQATSVTLYAAVDLRLDAPFPFLSPEMTAARKAEARETFATFLSSAAEDGATHVILAGNLLSSEYTTDATVRFLISEIGKYPSITFIVLPGDEDVRLLSSVYLSERFPKNLRVFSSEKPDRIDTESAVFYGAVYTEADEEAREDAIRGFADAVRKVEGKPTFLLLPYGREAAAATVTFGAHCTLLTSPSGTATEVVESTPLVLLLGAGEGRSLPGKGEGVKITVTEENGGYRLSATPVPYSRRSYVFETFSVAGAETPSDVRERIAAEVARKGYGSDTFLVLTLTGTVSPELLMHLDGDSYGLYGIRITDDTLPTHGGEELFRDMSVRGELYRSLEGALRLENAADRRVIAEAVRLGLAALDDRDRD